MNCWTSRSCMEFPRERKQSIDKVVVLLEAEPHHHHCVQIRSINPQNRHAHIPHCYLGPYQNPCQNRTNRTKPNPPHHSNKHTNTPHSCYLHVIQQRSHPQTCQHSQHHSLHLAWLPQHITRPTRSSHASRTPHYHPRNQVQQILALTKKILTPSWPSKEYAMITED